MASALLQLPWYHKRNEEYMKYLSVFIMALVVSTLTRTAIRSYKQYKGVNHGNDGSTKAR